MDLLLFNSILPIYKYHHTITFMFDVRFHNIDYTFQKNFWLIWKMHLILIYKIWTWLRSQKGQILGKILKAKSTSNSGLQNLQKVTFEMNYWL